jgi:hypothetical protein
MAKKIKSRLGADGYNYPYTHEDLIFDDEGTSLSQRLENLATKDYVDQEINNRLSELQIVKITQVEYDALTTKEPNTLYLIVK